MCVCTHPSEVEQPPPSQKNVRKEEGEVGPAATGGMPLVLKNNNKKEGSLVAPGPRASAAKARAAPSPGRASSRARVGLVLAATLREILLGVVPGAPPGLPTQIGPGDNSQRTTQGGGWAGSPRAQEGGPLSAWYAPSARQPMCSRSKSPAPCCRRLCVRSCRHRRHRRRHGVPWHPPSRGRPVRESSELGYTRARHACVKRAGIHGPWSRDRPIRVFRSRALGPRTSG